VPARLDPEMSEATGILADRGLRARMPFVMLSFL